jgi:hypothetical protein
VERLEELNHLHAEAGELKERVGRVRCRRERQATRLILDLRVSIVWFPSFVRTVCDISAAFSPAGCVSRGRVLSVASGEKKESERDWNTCWSSRRVSWASRRLAR